MVWRTLFRKIKRHRLTRTAKPWGRIVLHPIAEGKRWVEYWSFARENKAVFQTEDEPKTRNRALIVSLMGDSVSAAKIEAFLAFGLLLKGCETSALTTRGSWSNRYYRLLGVKHFVYFDDFLATIPTETMATDVQQAMAQCSSFQALMDYEFHGVKIGKYVCSSLVRRTYTGTVDLQDPKTHEDVRHSLYQAMETTLVAEKIMDAHTPAMLLFLERGYSPYGEFFDVALNRGLNTIQWCGSHRDNAMTLKRYSRENADQHPASLSPKTWAMLEQLPWNTEKVKSVENELFENYSSGKWFSEVGTQFNTRIFDPADIKQMLGLDPTKKTAVVFSHLFWDATFFWGTDLFDNYQEWFMETVKAACKNNHLNWVLKLHPANIVKLSRDGYKKELVEKQALAREIGTLPSHIKILEPSTPISTYSLYQAIDYCFTVRGTVGIEAAIFGVPVITAGTGRYDSHGFTIDSASRKEYLDRIAQVHTYPRLPPEQIERAQKFAYGTFLLRPFPLEGLRISYTKNRVATQKIEFLYGSKAELERSRDLKQFAAWALDSQDQDYLDR